MTRHWRAAISSASLLCGALLLAPASWAQVATAGAVGASPADKVPATTQSGRDIYQRFREGLADPHCQPGSSSSRWREHFAAAPERLAAGTDDLLPLFGYVVDALREASLPTEYALIPFVESRYRPAAVSPAGTAGLWQMIGLTARAHHVPMRAGYDGRLSPVDSTKAAVRYLKTLHGMFAGDWRLAVMAYNAGEYRILGALRRSGQQARNAKPEQLPGLSGITHAYVRKLHALSCLMEQADDGEDWLRSIDRPVPRLAAVSVPDDIVDIAGWSARSGQDSAQLQRLNPVFGDGRIGRIGGVRAPLLAVAPTTSAVTSTRPPATPVVTIETTATSAIPAPLAAGSPSVALTSTPTRRHSVVTGDNAWTIARRYGIRVAELLERNRLVGSSVLRPGTVLQIDPGDILTPRNPE